jgi:iron(III) transport system substrate-binding protein
MSRGRRGFTAFAVGLLLLTTGCSQPATSRSEPITLYTCVNDTTVQPVISAFKTAHPGTEVQLFRAPTGQLNARVATDVRSGGLKADVIWACDPLTMQDFVTQGLVGGWTPQTDIPKAMRTPDYVGIALLYMVAITRKGQPALAKWPQLADAGKVAVPDPKVAASALGALAYFGTDFYANLRSKGAVQVSTPDDVTNGVAQGIYDAGMTIANSAYAAAKSASPVTVSWPKPGAIAIYGPVAVSKTTENRQLAQDFASYLTSPEGQAVIGSSGSYPTLPGVAGPTKPENAPTVQPDWEALTSQKAALLKDYASIFGA